jgi:hypothetical protein
MDSIKNAHITEDLRMEDIQYQIEGNRWDSLDMLKKWMSTEYQNDYCKWRCLEEEQGANHEHSD